MARMTGGQALVQSLKLEGIDTIFGLPGIQLDWAFDALYDERDAIQRHPHAPRAGTAPTWPTATRAPPEGRHLLVVPGPGC